MTMKHLKIFIAVALATVALGARAQEKTDIFNPEHNSVTSQTIAPDARAAGMGDVGAATDPDVNSQYWNPAKYPFCISRAGVALNYTPWLRQLVNDMDLAYLAGYYRIGDHSAVSASLRYFSLGEVMMEEDAGGMTINPYEMSIDVAYSLMLSEKFSLAAAVRWIYSDITYNYTEETRAASAFAADIACYYQNYIMIGQRECQLGLGLNISNIGSKINFDGSENSEFIPANMRLGASLMVPIDEYNRFTIAPTPTSCLFQPSRFRRTGSRARTMTGVCSAIITTFRASAAYSRASATRPEGSRRSCRRYAGASARSMFTTTSSACARAITMSPRTRETANTSPSEPVSA